MSSGGVSAAASRAFAFIIRLAVRSQRRTRFVAVLRPPWLRTAGALRRFYPERKILQFPDGVRRARSGSLDSASLHSG